MFNNQLSGGGGGAEALMGRVCPLCGINGCFPATKVRMQQGDLGRDVGVLSALGPCTPAPAQPFQQGMPSLGFPAFHGVFTWLPFPLPTPLVPVGAGIHDFRPELFWAPYVGQKASVRNVLAILRCDQKLAFIVKKAGDLAENSKDWASMQMLYEVWLGCHLIGCYLSLFFHLPETAGRSQLNERWKIIWKSHGATQKKSSTIISSPQLPHSTKWEILQGLDTISVFSHFFSC